MFLLHFILFIIVFNTVYVQSQETPDGSPGVSKKDDSDDIKVDDGTDGDTDDGKDGDTDAGKDGDTDDGMDGDTDDGKDGDSKTGNDDDTQNDNDDNNQDKKQSSPETDDGNDRKDGSDSDEVKSKEDVKRAMQTGDTFTPIELLPIAKKLLAKVRLGEGRGIVSGAKSAEDLADKLFAAYFLTSKRIVILTDNDLSGLDALQALAVSGEAVAKRAQGDSITEGPLQPFQLNGQLVSLDDQPERCHYKVIHKTVAAGDTALRKGQKATTRFDKTLKMEKHMRPNRHLIINRKVPQKQKQNHKLRKGKHSENKRNKGEVDMVKNNGEKNKRIKHSGRKVMKAVKQKVARHRETKHRKPRNKNTRSILLRNKNKLTTTQRPMCKWRYICKNPSELDSCRLHTSCVGDNSNKAIIDNEYVDAAEQQEKKTSEQEKEVNELVVHFRKALGLTLMDEEVEKIIEKHVALIRPRNISPDQRIETLEEYFNNLIMVQHQSTRPADPERGSKSIAMIGSDEDTQVSKEDARQLLLQKKNIRHEKVTKPLTPSDKKVSTKKFNIIFRRQNNIHAIQETTITDNLYQSTVMP